ncbi:MAG: DUF3341 domain-containing protein [Gemmatimonadota bacterium]|nr:DUF3341 domain-containing protein [Gemmatimonadota bacterium]
MPPMPFKRKEVPGVLASFRHVDAATDAIRALRDKGYRDLTVYTAAANHEIEDALGHGVSPVRMFTLLGGLTGVTAGFAMQIWMNLDWPLLVGGKPISAIPAFVVIGFELTILVGSLVTLFGVFVLSISKAHRKVLYDPQFSDDRIGVFVAANPGQVTTVERMLRDAGAVEVRNG